MREYLDDADLANYIRMLRSAGDKAILVVEGDSDVRAIRVHTDDDTCDVVSGYGRTLVLKAVEELNAGDPDWLIALIDRDFGPWQGEHLPSNVFCTVLYDLQADFLLELGLLARYVDASVDTAKARQLLETSTAASVEDVIIGIAESVGHLRWSSIRDRLELSLSRFPVANIINAEGAVSVRKMAEIALLRTTDCALSVSGILASYQVPLPMETSRDVCSSHDLISATVATQPLWSNNKDSKDSIITAITVAVSFEMLDNLEWFHSLSAWAVHHQRTIWKTANSSGGSRCVTSWSASAKR